MLACQGLQKTTFQNFCNRTFTEAFPGAIKNIETHDRIGLFRSVMVSRLWTLRVQSFPTVPPDILCLTRYCKWKRKKHIHPESLRLRTACLIRRVWFPLIPCLFLQTRPVTPREKGSSGEEITARKRNWKPLTASEKNGLYRQRLRSYKTTLEMSGTSRRCFTNRLPAEEVTEKNWQPVDLDDSPWSLKSLFNRYFSVISAGSPSFSHFKY